MGYVMLYAKRWFVGLMEDFFIIKKILTGNTKLIYQKKRGKKVKTRQKKALLN